MSAPFTTPVLDTFVRAAENPLSDGGNWAAVGLLGSGQQLKTNGTNALTTTAGGTYSGSYWTQVFALPVEAFVTLAAVPATDFCDIQWYDNPASASPNGYDCSFGANANGWAIYRISAGSFTSIASGTYAPALANGDSVGMTVGTDGTITAWRQSGGGGLWLPLGHIKDTSFSGPGSFLIDTNDTATLFSNFGAGQTTTALLPPAYLPPALGPAAAKPRFFARNPIYAQPPPLVAPVAITADTDAVSAATCRVAAPTFVAAQAAAAQSAAAAQVTVPQPIGPSASAQSAAACSVTIPRPVTPNTAAQSAATCFVTAAVRIQPVASATSAAACFVSATTYIAPSAAAQSAAAAVVAVPQPFTATASATSAAQCTVTVAFLKTVAGNPFTYPAWDAMTGSELDDLPYTNVQFGRIVNQPGPFSGSLLLSDPGVQKLNYLGSTIEGRTLVGVEFAGELVWLGMIWTTKYKRSQRTMVVGAQELGSWFASRVQAVDYTATWQDGADPLAICQQIVEDMLGAGTLGFTINVDVTPAITVGGGGANGQAFTYAKNGVYTWQCPTGVTSIQVECWGGGGGGGGGGTAAADGGGGGGGGGYAINPAVTVVPGTNYTITVGAGGAGASASSTGSPGGNSSATFGATTVTGSGGTGGHGSNSTPNAGGAGGAGTGTTTYSGGTGGQGSNYGGGGGSSAGQSSGGNQGGDGLHTYHAPGGAAPAGGGPGGNGDGGGGSGNTPTVGPGGGGGGGTGQARDRGGAGFDGQVVLTTPATGGGSGGSGQQVTVSYPLTQMQTVQALLNILTAMGYSYGPDVTVDYAYSPGTRTPVITVNFWYPRSGQYNPATISIDIANATEFEYDVDASQQAWRVTEKGGGGGGLQPVTQTAPQVGSAGWPLLEAVFSRAQVNTSDVLENIAKGDLSIRAWPVTIPTVTVPIAMVNPEGVLDPHGLAFSQLTIGDDMQLAIDPVPLDANGNPSYGINNDPRFPSGMNFTWRNTNWTAQVPAKGIPVFVLALAVPPSLSTNPTRPPR